MTDYLILKEYLTFLEIKKLNLEKYRENYEKLLRINPHEFYDLLMEIDNIIILSLNTLKNLLIGNTNNILDVFSNPIHNQQLLGNLQELEYCKSRKEERSDSPTYVKLGLRHNFKALSKLKNSSEFVKFNKLRVNNKNNPTTDSKKNFSDFSFNKQIFVIDQLKKMHLRDDFKDLFANKFGEGSYENFKNRILKNEYNEEILDQIIKEIKIFQEKQERRSINNSEQQINFKENLKNNNSLNNNY